MASSNFNISIIKIDPMYAELWFSFLPLSSKMVETPNHRLVSYTTVVCVNHSLEEALPIIPANVS